MYKKTDKTFFIIFFLIHKNINRVLLKKQKKVSKTAHKRNQNLSDEEKNKKRQYVRERYRNLSKEEERNKSISIVVKDIEIFQKERWMKKVSCV